jgi:ferredoxin
MLVTGGRKEHMRTLWPVVCLASVVCGVCGVGAAQVQPVFSVPNSGSQTHLPAVAQVLEDVSFFPGAWANAVGRVLTEAYIGVAVLQVSTTNEQVLVIFWRQDDVSFAGFDGPGSEMINGDASPLGVVRLDANALAAGFYWGLGITGFQIPIPDGDTGVFVQAVWVSNGCTPVRYQDMTGCLLPYSCSNPQTTRGLVSTINQIEVGSTSPTYSRDMINDAMCGHTGQFISPDERVTGTSPGRSLAVWLRGTSTGRVECTADFDGNSDAGTDADIEAFFACLEGACCGSCASPDVDGDGTPGTDSDIESFFSVLAGGPC